MGTWSLILIVVIPFLSFPAAVGYAFWRRSIEDGKRRYYCGNGVHSKTSRAGEAPGCLLQA